jgi:hypothetical protein
LRSRLGSGAAERVRTGFSFGAGVIAVRELLAEALGQPADAIETATAGAA